MSVINVFHDAPRSWEVWIDTDENSRDGTCIGAGETRELALRDAKRELLRRLKEINRAQSAYHRIAAT